MWAALEGGEGGELDAGGGGRMIKRPWASVNRYGCKMAAELPGLRKDQKDG